MKFSHAWTSEQQALENTAQRNRESSEGVGIFCYLIFHIPVYLISTVLAFEQAAGLSRVFYCEPLHNLISFAFIFSSKYVVYFVHELMYLIYL